MVERVHEYASKRLIPIGKEESIPLSELPVMRDTISRIRNRWNQLSKFVQILEQKYGENDEISDRLVDAISCAKIECIRFATEVRIGARGEIFGN